MFEKSLQTKLRRIFELNKVTFDAPSDENEQECLFIQVDDDLVRIKDGSEVHRVMGVCTVFALGNKMPFGYLSKQVRSAAYDDTKDLFFYDFESNVKVFGNIVRRSFSFVYFFSGQYNPPAGTIESVEFIT